jgi:deoxyadenosine/deoxycytidine kinase
LARELDARLALEVVEENPFLARFYADPTRHAFATQIFLLLSRYRQQQEFFQQDLFQRRVVSDYLFAKDRIFANLNLSDAELQLYDRSRTSCRAGCRPPTWSSTCKLPSMC